MQTSPAYWIETQQHAMLDLLKDLVSIDSHSYYKEGVAKVFRRLQVFFESHGLTTESHFVDGIEAALSVTVNSGSSSNRPILLMGHCDTVFPKGEVKKRPFRIEGNRAYGPGVADMKAGVVMNAFIIASLAHTGVTSPEVTALFTCDEEIGSPLSKSVIEKFAKKSAFVFNSEPGRPSGNVVTGRKGGIFLEMDVQGKAAHSGANFSEGINAISEIANKIVELDKLTDIDEGLTVSVGLISGGQSVNTSAPSAKASIDVRVKDLEQREQIMSRIRCICNKNFITGTLSKLDVIGEFKPFVPSEDSQALFRLYRDTLASLGHKTDQEFSGGCADSGVTSSLGAITLCATGPIGGKFHTPDEYTEIDSFVPRAKAVLMTLNKVHEIKKYLV